MKRHMLAVLFAISQVATSTHISGISFGSEVSEAVGQIGGFIGFGGNPDQGLIKFYRGSLSQAATASIRADPGSSVRFQGLSVYQEEYSSIHAYMTDTDLAFEDRVGLKSEAVIKVSGNTVMFSGLVVIGWKAALVGRVDHTLVFLKSVVLGDRSRLSLRNSAADDLAFSDVFLSDDSSVALKRFRNVQQNIWVGKGAVLDVDSEDFYALRVGISDGSSVTVEEGSNMTLNVIVPPNVHISVTGFSLLILNSAAALPQNLDISNGATLIHNSDDLQGVFAPNFFAKHMLLSGTAHIANDAQVSGRGLSVYGSLFVDSRASLLFPDSTVQINQRLTLQRNSSFICLANVNVNEIVILMDSSIAVFGGTDVRLDANINLYPFANLNLEFCHKCSLSGNIFLNQGSRFELRKKAKFILSKKSILIMLPYSNLELEPGSSLKLNIGSGLKIESRLQLVGYAKLVISSGVYCETKRANVIHNSTVILNEGFVNDDFKCANYGG